MFGEHAPFDDATLDSLYRNRGEYVSAVAEVSNRNVEDGYIDRADAVVNIREAASSGIGK